MEFNWHPYLMWGEYFQRFPLQGEIVAYFVNELHIVDDISFDHHVNAASVFGACVVPQNMPERIKEAFDRVVNIPEVDEDDMSEGPDDDDVGLVHNTEDSEIDEDVPFDGSPQGLNIVRRRHRDI